MARSRLIPVLIALAAWFGGLDGNARADLVKLKGGGELRGVFLDPLKPGRAPAKPVRVETLTGAIITVSHEDVAFVTRRSRDLEEYEWRTRLAPDTAEAHWELQAWCKERGLRKERDEELRRVIEFDPDHAAAHRLLGHINENGKWQSRDEAMAAKGYVKYKGKYRFPQEVELLEADDLRKEAEVAWHRKLHQWQGWLRNGNPAQQVQARRELEGIDDPDAIGPLVRLFRNENADDVRLIFVRVLAKFPIPPAVHALVMQSLFDSSPTVRAAAMGAIEGKSREMAIPIYVKALDDSLNVVVIRSAVALGHFAEPETIPSLIEALVTTHTYKQVVEERGYIAQGALTGIPQSELMMPPARVPLSVPGMPLPLSMGAPGPVNPQGSSSNTVPIPTPVVRERTVMVTRPVQNQEVLAVLRKMTAEDFGYDERTWRLWWSTQANQPKLMKSPATATTGKAPAESE